jgi:L-galactono-1,4-lactone dehydrogenase
MSPAYSTNPDEVFSWIGIIMYIPASSTPQQRDEIRKQFSKYCSAIQPLLEEYNAQVHWAKIELPNRNDMTEDEYNNAIDRMRLRLSAKYPLNEFNELMRALDPNQILTNDIIDELISDRCPLYKDCPK